MKPVLKVLTSLFDKSGLNSNMKNIQRYIETNLVHRSGALTGKNLEQDIDAGGKRLTNLKLDGPTRLIDVIDKLDLCSIKYSEFDGQVGTGVQLNNYIPPHREADWTMKFYVKIPAGDYGTGGTLFFDGVSDNTSQEVKLEGVWSKQGNLGTMSLLGKEVGASMVSGKEHLVEFNVFFTPGYVQGADPDIRAYVDGVEVGTVQTAAYTPIPDTHMVVTNPGEPGATFNGTSSSLTMVRSTDQNYFTEGWKCVFKIRYKPGFAGTEGVLIHEPHSSGLANSLQINNGGLFFGGVGFVDEADMPSVEGVYTFSVEVLDIAANRVVTFEVKVDDVVITSNVFQHGALSIETPVQGIIMGERNSTDYLNTDLYFLNIGLNGVLQLDLQMFSGVLIDFAPNGRPLTNNNVVYSNIGFMEEEQPLITNAVVGKEFIGLMRNFTLYVNHGLAHGYKLDQLNDVDLGTSGTISTIDSVSIGVEIVNRLRLLNQDGTCPLPAIDVGLELPDVLPTIPPPANTVAEFPVDALIPTEQRTWLELSEHFGSIDTDYTTLTHEFYFIKYAQGAGAVSGYIYNDGEERRAIRADGTNTQWNSGGGIIRFGDSSAIPENFALGGFGNNIIYKMKIHIGDQGIQIFRDDVLEIDIYLPTAYTANDVQTTHARPVIGGAFATAASGFETPHAAFGGKVWGYKVTRDSSVIFDAALETDFVNDAIQPGPAAPFNLITMTNHGILFVNQ